MWKKVLLVSQIIYWTKMLFELIKLRANNNDSQIISTESDFRLCNQTKNVEEVIIGFPYHILNNNYIWIN